MNETRSGIPLTELGAPSPDVEDASRRRLKRNRALATGLLAFAAALFALTYLVPEPGFWVLLVRTAAEAGVVGGLADWFAVTALFRRPLGLPIPHTAIIPNNKERMGRALGRFVERNFLAPEVLVARLRAAGFGRHLAHWLSEPTTADLVAGAVGDAVPYLVHSLNSPDLHHFAERTIGEQLRRVDAGPVLARIIRAVSESGEADVIFERIITLAADWLRTHRSEIDQAVHARSYWWIPKTVDRRIADSIVEGAADLLARLAEPDSDIRQQFRAAIDDLATNLVESPEQRRTVNESKDRILSDPEVQAWIGSLWKELADAAIADASAPDSHLRAGIANGLQIVGRRLAADEAMQGHIDSALEHLAERLVSWRGEIGTFIADVVSGWDARTLSDRLELVVGSDLQYIRMNGTIVGSLAGCAIFLLTQLFT